MYFFFKERSFLHQRYDLWQKVEFLHPIGNRKDVKAAIVTCILIHTLYININLIRWQFTNHLVEFFIPEILGIIIIYHINMLKLQNLLVSHNKYNMCLYFKMEDYLCIELWEIVMPDTLHSYSFPIVVPGILEQ